MLSVISRQDSFSTLDVYNRSLLAQAKVSIQVSGNGNLVPFLLTNEILWAVQLLLQKVTDIL